MCDLKCNIFIEKNNLDLFKIINRGEMSIIKVNFL
jgi:hypothetical protein